MTGALEQQNQQQGAPQPSPAQQHTTGVQHRGGVVLIKPAGTTACRCGRPKAWLRQLISTSGDMLQHLRGPCGEIRA